MRDSSRQNHYEEAHVPTVEIVIWRGRNRLTARVPTLAWCSYQRKRQSLKRVSLAYGLYERDASDPKYQLDREFKGTFTEEPAQIVKRQKLLLIRPSAKERLHLNKFWWTEST